MDDENSGDEDDSERPLESVSLSLDATLELLANRQRRDLLAYLIDEPDHTASVDEIVAHLTEQAASQTGELPGHDQTTAALLHVHLPKLADLGVVEYDARSATIRYRGDERLEDWLERIRTADED